MSDSEELRPLQMPLEKASELATECWRLCKWTKASNTFGTDRQVLDRVARRLNEILNTIGVRTIDLAGTAYDPGIVSEVLDVQIDSTLPRGTSLIDETVLPRLVPLWNDKGYTDRPDYCEAGAREV